MWCNQAARTGITRNDCLAPFLRVRPKFLARLTWRSTAKAFGLKALPLRGCPIYSFYTFYGFGVMLVTILVSFIAREVIKEKRFSARMTGAHFGSGLSQRRGDLGSLYYGL